tara:strand:+ start:1006 stop:1476 length:471 start_codon:yes stop_codon:yes gene_type:complete
VRLIPFCEDHVVEILDAALDDEHHRPAPEFGAWVKALVVEDMAFTGLDDAGRVIGAGGVIPIWEGVGDAWFLGSARVTANRIAVARAMRGVFRQIARDHGLRRIQGAMRSDWPQLGRWARFLGMRHEGSMPRYGADGADYERWAWTDRSRDNSKER